MDSTNAATDIDTKTHWTGRTTISVAEAGLVLGLGRSAAYAAVRRGDIPALRFGRRYVVPTARLQAMLGTAEPGSAELPY
ncbi:hypothetical protein acdb102_15860 [Acidothermaceae bacterium B102]|nr:hypothetical protein acdb102_15860 [Acidothermaceae bacterium B102]